MKLFSVQLDNRTCNYRKVNLLEYVTLIYEINYL